MSRNGRGLLGRVLSVESGEWHHVATLGGHFFLVLAAGTALTTVAKSLFVGTYPRTWLPFGYLGGSLIGVGASYLYGRLSRRTTAPRTTITVASALTVLLAALWVMALVAPAAGPFALLLVAPGYNVLFGVENAGLVARTLDPRSARRLYAAVGSIGGIGATCGALLAGRLGPVLGVANVLWLCAGLVVLSLVPALRVRVDRRSERPRRPGPWRTVLRERLPLLLMGLVIVASVLNNLANYQLDCAAKDALGDPVRLSAFYGNVNALLNAISILLPFLVARPLIARLGVGASFAVYPALMLAVGLSGIGLPVLVTFASAMMVERLFRQNLQRPLLNIATLPMSGPVRDRTALALRGALESPATAVTAVGLLVTAGVVPWRSLSWVVAAVAAAGVVAALVARRDYVRELVASLHARRLRLDDEPDQPAELDATLRELLVRQLGSETPATAALALHLLAGRFDEASVARVGAMWRTWEPWVRAAALDALAGCRVPAAVALMRRAAGDGDADVAAAAVRALGDAAGEDDVARALAHPEPEVKAEGLTQAWRRGDADRVTQTIGEWAASTDPELRAMAVRVAGRTGMPGMAALVRRLAQGAPAEALAVLARRPDPEMAAFAVARLADPELAEAARIALAAIGEPAVPALADAAARPGTSAASLVVLGSLATPAARRAISACLESADDPTRLRAARALASATAGQGPSSEEEEAVSVAAEHELDMAGRLMAERAASTGPWADELAVESDAALERALLLLAVLHPGRPVRRVAASLVAGEPSERAFAVEAADEMLEQPWRRRVVGLLESGPGEAPSVLDDDPWRARARAALSRPGSDPVLDLALELKAAAPFARWRLRDLEAVAAVAQRGGGDATSDGGLVRVVDGAVPTLRDVLLGQPAGEVGPGDLVVPLAAVWRTAAARPSATSAWLAGIADLLSPAPTAGADVSRSQLLSLASRTLGEDHDASDDLGLWRRVFFLRTAPLFEGLGPARLRLVASIARSVHAAAGETVVGQGRTGRHFYLVCSGRVEVLVDDRRVAELSAAEAFGAHALLTGRTRSATVRAIEASDLLCIDRVDFLDLLDTQPGLVAAFSVLLARQSSPQGGELSTTKTPRHQGES